MFIILVIITVIIFVNYQRYRSHQISLLPKDERNKVIEEESKHTFTWLWMFFGIPLLIILNLDEKSIIILYVIIIILIEIIVSSVIKIKLK